MSDNKLKLDEIGPWSEIKLEIIRKYASAYSRILSKQKMRHSYLDAFAGAGMHISKETGEQIEGSPLIALNTSPPFHDYHLIDLDSAKAYELRRIAAKQQNVHVYEGDCNQILLNIIPSIQWNEYKRALCLLDPYGLHLDWKLIELAGKIKTVEVFLNFPVADMNRNVFWHHPKDVAPDDVARMTRFWGDESWRSVAYETQEDFFEPQKVRTDNHTVAKAFQARLKEVAGFAYVPDPLPMKNSQNAVVYYLFFASPNNTGAGIVEDILNRYR